MTIDPAELFLPAHRPDGPDLFKYVKQVKDYGASTIGMGAIVVRQGANGLPIVGGLTRAARVAKLLPGQSVTVEVQDTFPGINFRTRRVKDILGGLPDP